MMSWQTDKIPLPASEQVKNGKTIFGWLIYGISALADLATANMWILEGTPGPKNKNFKILFAGSQVQKHFVAKHFFSTLTTESFLGKKNFLRVLRLIHKNTAGCDLAVIEGETFHKVVYKRRNDFFVPTWLKSYLKIPLKVANRSAKEDLRKIRKNNLTYIMTKDPDHYNRFYQEMYLPYVQQRHQGSTVAMNFEIMMKKANEGSCELLLVMKEKLAIAGILIVKDEKIPRLWSNGLKNGDLTYWKEGAIAATYYFASEHLAQQGYTEMNMGLLRSFYNDGVFQYKKKWGILVAADSPAGFIIKPLVESEELQNWLVGHPFLFCRDHKLCGAVFTRSTIRLENESVTQLIADHSLSGMAELDLFYLNSLASSLKPDSTGGPSLMSAPAPTRSEEV